MGLDLNAICEHSLRGQLHDFAELVPKHLNSIEYSDPLLVDRLRLILKPEYLLEWSSSPWRLDRTWSLDEMVLKHRCVQFNGPLGLLLRVGAESFDLWTPFRVWAFLLDADLQVSLLRVIGRVTIALGGTRVLIVPDNATRSSSYADWIMKPASIAEIEGAMRSEIGAPCVNPEEWAARKEEDVDYDGYLAYRYRRDA